MLLKAALNKIHLLLGIAVVLLIVMYLVTKKSPEVRLPTTHLSRFSYKLYVVYHVCPVGTWSTVVNEQLQQFVNSGLYKAAERIWICTAEPADEATAASEATAATAAEKVRAFISANWSSLEKIRVLFDSQDHTWENETLNALINKSKQIVADESEAYVLYLHNKASWHNNARGQSWRHNMMLYIVEEWNRCAQLLEIGYKTVGPFHNWASRYYSGNFWWARASYLADAEPIAKDADRGAAERFLLKGRNLDKQHANLKSISLLDHILYEFNRGALLQ